MIDFLPEQYPVLTEKRFEDGFVPLAVEVHSVTEAKEDLLSNEFGTSPKISGGLRTHSSLDAAAQAEERKRLDEELAANRVVFEKEEFELILEQAREEGRQAALLETVETQTKKLEDSEKKLHAVLSDLQRQFALAIADIENSALNLTLELSKKIIDHAVEVNPEYIVAVIRDALELSGGAQVKKVRVSPQDMEFIEVLKVAPSIKEFDGSWTFEADETVRAGCILESSAGTVDFQLDKAWERIKDKIVSSVRS